MFIPHREIKSTDIGECTTIDLTGWSFKIMKKFYYVGETLWANAVTVQVQKELEGDREWMT